VIAEYNASNVLLRRYVHGPGREGGRIINSAPSRAGVDEPLVWYTGSGVNNRQWLLADERGTIVYTDRENYQEQWKMQNGNIDRRGDVFTANGALEGFRMVGQEGGATKRVRLEANSYMPFHTRIECK